MPILKSKDDMKLFIDGVEEMATSVTIDGEFEAPNYVQPHRVQFWPEGKWEPGYLLERALIDTSCRAAVDEPVVIGYDIRGGPVTRIKPVWWRRLLNPMRRLICRVK